MSRFSIEATFTAVDKMTAPVTQMEKVTRSLSTGIRADFAMMKSSFGNFKNSIFGNLMAYDLFKQAVFAAGGAIKYTVQQAAQMENSFAQFTTLLGGNSASAEKLVGDLQLLGAETPFEFKDLADATQRLLGFGVATKDNVIPTLRMLGDLSQGSAEKLQGISLVYGQIMAGGKMMGQDFNQLINQGVPIAQGLAKVWGVDVNEAIKRVKQNGPVMAADVLKAMQQMTSEGGLFFNGMIRSSQTTTGVFSTMMDAINMTATGIGTALLPVVKEIAIDITRIATEVLQWVQANKELIKTNVRSWFETFKTGVGYIIDVVKFLYEMRDVIEWIIKLWVLYKAVQLAAFGAEQIKNIVGWIKYLWQMRDVIGKAILRTESWTIAQKALNFIMNMNPIGLIIIAIGLLAYAIYDLYTNWDTYALSFNIKIQDMVTGFYRAKLAVMDLMNSIGLISDKELTVAKLDFLENFTKGTKMKIEYLQKGNSVFKEGSELQNSRREVSTQSQQVASAINSSKNITTNRNVTTQQNMNLVIQNMNPGLIGIQSYYSGI